MTHSQPPDSSSSSDRKLRSEDIHLPPEFRIEVFTSGLTTPINMTLNESWGDHHNNRVVFGPDGYIFWTRNRDKFRGGRSG